MPEEKQNSFINKVNRVASYILNRKINKKKAYTAFLVAFCISFAYVFINKPTQNFPIGEVVSITPGESLQTIAENLKTSGVIKYPTIFRMHVILLGGERSVIAGDYLFDKKQGPDEIAYRLIKGDFHLDVIRATIPEGWNVFQIADYLEKILTNFDKNNFIEIAKKEEGYLFPETYFFPPRVKPNTVIGIMKGMFEDKIETISALATSTYSIKDVITMASILEAEGVTTESRQIIAGILWNRLSIGMPLQVDSTFTYINGKNTYELTLNDLKIDSPYNTYKYKGLPPSPINNPGIDSINAALNPIETKYLYFLSSRSGKMYYATTFEQHKRNKELYLNK